MPIHEWSRVDAGTFHDFHQAWTIEIRNALNGGGLSDETYAMVFDATPQARFVTSAELDLYATRANRIAIKHRLGRVVAVIEIVSPGNRGSRHALRALVEKAAELLRQGIHLLVVDLFPPSVRDPQGIHKEIWDEIKEERFELPQDKRLTVAAYCAAEPITAYVNTIAVGDELLPAPIFLDARTYVPAPLEATYQSTWAKCPEPVREAVEGGGA